MKGANFPSTSTSRQWDGKTKGDKTRCPWVPDDVQALVLADVSHLLAALTEGEVPAHHAILQRKVPNMKHMKCLANPNKTKQKNESMN